MKDNKAVVRQYIERVWNQQDYTAIDENIREDYIQHSRVVGQPGREPVRAFFNMVHSGFSEINYTLEDMLAEGDKVAFRWTLRGRHTGTFQGIPPTNKEFVLTGLSFLRLEDGKFAENWVEQDMLGLMQQLRS